MPTAAGSAMPALAAIPVWVPFLLAALVAAGIRLSRSREQASGVALGLALGMGALSLFGVVSGFGAALAPVAMWLLGMAAALTLGARVVVPRGLAFVAERRRVFVPGSWWPLALMLGIFAIKFVLGAAAGMGAPVSGHSAVAAVAGFALGLFSGGFAARSAAVLRVARRGPVVVVPAVVRG